MELAPFVKKQIRKSNRNLLVVNLLLVLGLAWAAQASATYWYNFYYGPFRADAGFLSGVTSPHVQGKAFFTVSGDRSIETGVQQISQTKNKHSGQVTSEQVTSEYIVLVMGEQLLLVKADHGHQRAHSFSGTLKQIPADVYGRVIAEAQAKAPGIAEKFFPFMLDEEDYRTGGYIGLVIGFPLFCLGLWNAKKVFSRISDPCVHPIFVTLSRYGEPYRLSSLLDAEVKQGPKKFGSWGNQLEVTKSWIFKRGHLGLKLVSFDGLAWVYKKVTSHSVNFIPTGKTYAVVVHSRFGDTIEGDMSEQEVNLFLETVAAAAPWVVFGYTTEMQALWDKQRPAFYQAVEERKAKQAAPRPAPPSGTMTT